VVLTIYPNYTVSLNDPNLPSMLQIQLQITGAEQVSSAVMANLHHQVAHRLQNHAFDLPTGHAMGIPIIATNNRNQEDMPTLIEAPKAITRDELLFLMPKEWITNYKNCHQRYEALHSSGTYFQTLTGGRVKITFTLPKPEPPQHSFIQLMILPYNDKERKQQRDIPVHSFEANGYPVSTDKINGHFIWDVNPSMCDPGCDCDKLTDEDIECENPRSQRARKWCAKHVKTPCGLQIYYPHDDEDNYPKPIPIPPFSQKLTSQWKQKVHPCTDNLPSPQSNLSCKIQASSTPV
jgi:hypothetical protein